MFLFEVGLDSLGAVEEKATLEGSAPGCANAFEDGANHCAYHCVVMMIVVIVLLISVHALTNDHFDKHGDEDDHRNSFILYIDCHQMNIDGHKRSWP